MVPVGGGGLISGIAVALKTLRPTIRIIGVEAEQAASAVLSRQAGRVVELGAIKTIADGIAVKRGDLTFALMQQYVDDLVTVSDEDIAAHSHLHGAHPGGGRRGWRGIAGGPGRP